MSQKSTPKSQGVNSSNISQTKQPADDGEAKNNVCFLCEKPGLLMRKCPNKHNKRQESKGHESVGKTASTKQVTAEELTSEKSSDDFDLQNLLLSDSGEEPVRRVELQDKGSKTRAVMVILQGVPAIGVIDSADPKMIAPSHSMVV